MGAGVGCGFLSIRCGNRCEVSEQVCGVVAFVGCGYASEVNGSLNMAWEVSSLVELAHEDPGAQVWG